MAGWAAIESALAEAGLRPLAAPRPVHGGDISPAYRVTTAAGELFLKTGPAAAHDMFTAERDALLELARAGPVRVPRPLLAERSGESAFLALEWLELGAGDAGANRAFGAALADLHRHTADAHGWHRDNRIGRTPQPNARSTDWVGFWRERRLGHQLALARANGYGRELDNDGRFVTERFALLFADYEPVPSLLHGDLWGGNWAVTEGRPVMFDPASYYGDRETDLAMTRLFGGFERGFYAAYAERWPLAPGAEARLPLYQLYHVLNHLNLFGSGYLGRARALLAEIRRHIEAR